MTKSNTEAFILDYLKHFGMSHDQYTNNTERLIHDYVSISNRQHNADCAAPELLDEKTQEYLWEEYQEGYIALLKKILEEKSINADIDKWIWWNKISIAEENA